MLYYYFLECETAREMSIPNKRNQMTVTDGKSISTYNDSGTSLYKVNQKKQLKVCLRTIRIMSHYVRRE